MNIITENAQWLVSPAFTFFIALKLKNTTQEYASHLWSHATPEAAAQFCSDHPALEKALGDCEKETMQKAGMYALGILGTVVAATTLRALCVWNTNRVSRNRQYERESLPDYIRAGNLEGVRRAHAAGADLGGMPNPPAQFGLGPLHAGNAVADGQNKETPLHTACRLGHGAIVDFLLEQHVWTDERSSKGDTALHLAARHSPNLVARLLAAGAARDIRNNDRETFLQVALSADQQAVFEANPDLVNFEADEQGNTLIHEAAKRGADQCLSFFLAREDFPEDILAARNADGKLPVDLAFAHCKDKPAAAVLLFNDARLPEGEKDRLKPEAVKKEDPTLLHALIGPGFNPFQDTPTAIRFFEALFEEGGPKMARYLCENCPKTILEKIQIEGMPLIDAALFDVGAEKRFNNPLTYPAPALVLGLNERGVFFEPAKAKELVYIQRSFARSHKMLSALLAEFPFSILKVKGKEAFLDSLEKVATTEGGWKKTPFLAQWGIHLKSEYETISMRASFKKKGEFSLLNGLLSKHGFISFGQRMVAAFPELRAHINPLGIPPHVLENPLEQFRAAVNPDNIPLLARPLLEKLKVVEFDLEDIFENFEVVLKGFKKWFTKHRHTTELHRLQQVGELLDDLIKERGLVGAARKWLGGEELESAALLRRDPRKTAGRSTGIRRREGKSEL